MPRLAPAAAAVLALGLVHAAANLPLRGAGLPKLTVERLQADPPLNGSLPTRLAWHPDGKRLTFVRRAGEGYDLRALDVSRGEQTTLLEGSRVKLPGDKPRPLSLAGARWLPDGRTMLATAGGDAFVVDTATGSVVPLVQTPESEEFFEPSPDGRRVAFVRANDLYVVDVATRRETRLTQGGSDTLLNGRLDWVYEEELASRTGRAFEWSPDSRAIAFLQLDQARVQTFPIVDFVPVRNEVVWQRYPKAGTPNAIVRLGVVRLEKDGTIAASQLRSFEPEDLYVLPQLAFTRDSRQVAFQLLNRAQSELTLQLWPVAASRGEEPPAPRTVLKETSKTWVNTFGPPLFLRDNHRFLWLSERDGFAHVYLCEMSGACRAVTQGPWVVDAQVSFASAAAPLLLDERTGFLYYTATEKDPRERHLYRTRLDGTGRVRLTREDGTHRTVVSPDGRFYADTWSDVATPTKVWVASQDGTRRFPIDDNPHPPLLDYERASLEFAELTAKDGTRLYGALVKPADFDAGKKYPVIVNVYGGPHAQTVTNSWGQVSAFSHLLASRGFLVWSLDNRGSTARGVAFESAINRQLGRTELEDQLAGVSYLKTLPYVDGSRIGITGWSYGGYMTLYALTNAPDVFRSGVAGAPVTDWKHYDSIYTERYMDTPEHNVEGYKSSSPIEKAGNLKADLLLVHGTADDNVHAANTMAFVAALIKAGRPYSLSLHPRQLHGFGAKDDRLARDREILAHFERTLLLP